MIDDVIAILRPETLGDLFIYISFLGALIATALIPEKNDGPMYLMFIVMFMAVIDLLRGDGSALPIDGFDNQGFGTFIIHIAMGILPFIAAGMVRRKGRKGGAAAPFMIMLGFIGVVYAIGAFAVPDAFYGSRIF